MRIAAVQPQAAGKTARGPWDGREERATAPRQAPASKDSPINEATDRLRRFSRGQPCNGPGVRGRAHLQAIEGDEVDLDAEAWATPRMPAPLRGAFGKWPAGEP